MATSDFLPYARPDIQPEDLEAVHRVLHSGWLSGGPEVSAFEAEFADYIGAAEAVAVSSGTAALHLCALALDLKPGQKVLVPAMTFVASANCILYAGGEPELVDIDPETLLLDLNEVEKKLEEAAPDSYAGIVAVDFAGFPVQMDRLRKLADAHDCWIIEDSCHAPGGVFTSSKGKTHQCGDGSLADLAIFSFHPVKHLTTGEGGMITTADPDLATRLRELRQHGITRETERLPQDAGGWYYEMQALGFNYKMSDLEAGLGRSQLSRAEAGLERRRELADRYNKLLKPLPVQLPAYAEGHAWHLYIIQTDHRRQVYDFLHDQGIGVQIHYIPLHFHPWYQKRGWSKGDFPVSEAYYDRCLSLPLFPALTDAEQDRVVIALEEALTRQT